MTRPKNLPSGQVVLVDKDKIEEKVPYKVLSQTNLIETKQKRPQSEAQKANTKRLVELMKARALERRGITTLPDNKIPDEIPPGKELVYIKPKKASTRVDLVKEVKEVKEDTSNKLYGVVESDKNSLLSPMPPPQVNPYAYPYMYAYPPPPPPPRPTKPTKPTRPRAGGKKKESFYEETSNDEEETTETETDTDTEINRYSKKVAKRTSALSKIEEELSALKSKLQKPTNKHQSIF